MRRVGTETGSTREDGNRCCALGRGRERFVGTETGTARGDGDGSCVSGRRGMQLVSTRTVRAPRDGDGCNSLERKEVRRFVSSRGKEVT